MANAPESNGPVMGDSPAVEIAGKIFVIAMVVSVSIVVCAIFFCIFVKWLSYRMELSSPPRPRNRYQRRRRNLNFASAQDPNVTPRRALEPAVLRSIPIVTFETEMFQDGLECAVCLNELADGEKARLLPKCNHGFHVDCIDMWFQSHSTCPLCRNPVAQESHIITIK